MRFVSRQESLSRKKITSQQNLAVFKKSPNGYQSATTTKLVATSNVNKSSVINRTTRITKTATKLLRLAKLMLILIIT